MGWPWASCDGDGNDDNDENDDDGDDDDNDDDADDEDDDDDDDFTLAHYQVRGHTKRLKNHPERRKKKQAQKQTCTAVPIRNGTGTAGFSTLYITKGVPTKALVSWKISSTSIGPRKKNTLL